MLYVFEDNEAVIKMTIKGRSPTMRHVSRTHRVALDWLFDRINLDPKIQIRYIDTKHQIADILTKGHFIRDEWNNLRLFNISHFSFLCCAKNSSLISCANTMAKRMQEQKRRRQKCGKIEIHSDELGWEETQNPTQRRVLKRDWKMHTLLQKRNQEMWIFPNLKLGVKKMWQGDRLLIKQLRGKPYASSKSDCQGRPKAEKTEWSHNLHLSPATVHHTEAVFSIIQGDLRTRTRWPSEWFGCKYGYVALFEQQFILDKSMRWIYDWRIIFATVQLFRETVKLISDQNELTGKRTIDFQDATWMQTKLIVRKSLSVHQHQNLHLRRLGALCGKNGRWSDCSLEEQN